MIVTNKLNLPDPLVRVVRNSQQPPRPGEKTIRTTSLIGPPQIRRLKAKHWDEITRDASDLLWALYGSIGHKILEEASLTSGAAEISEQKVEFQFNGWTITGTTDLILEAGEAEMWDYKMTSAWSTMDGAKPEWEQQQNIYRYALNVSKGIKLSGLNILALYRDWSETQAKKGGKYPQHAVEPFKLRMWSDAETEDFIAKQLARHENPDDECTDYDRWDAAPKFAVMKDGKKRAVKLHDTEVDAVVHASEIGGKVEKRGGFPRRCLDYCDVSKFCPQFKRMQEEWRKEQE